MLTQCLTQPSAGALHFGIDSSSVITSQCVRLLVVGHSRESERSAAHLTGTLHCCVGNDTISHVCLVLLLLLLLLLLQFTDEHGEVCPANWTPGAATMKADPKESLVRPLGFWCGYKLNILV
jgi:hypothetical protein